MAEIGKCSRSIKNQNMRPHELSLPSKSVYIGSPKEAYSDFVRSSDKLFRNFDQYNERPRQLVITVFLLIVVGFAAFGTPSITLTTECHTVDNINLITSQHLDVNHQSKNQSICVSKQYPIINEGRSVLVLIIAIQLLFLIVYCSLTGRDGLLIHPHPMFWRMIHGMGVAYVMGMTFLLLLSPSDGLWIIRTIFPEISIPLIEGNCSQNKYKNVNGIEYSLSDNKEPNNNNNNNNTVIEVLNMDHLQCELTLRTIKNSMTSIWFFAHVVGYMAKMLLLRSANLLFRYSILFELSELSLQWIIPEFRECWWDSLILDIFGANMLGIFLGYSFIKWMECKSYEWYSCGNTKMSRTVSGIIDGIGDRKCLSNEKISRGKRILSHLWFSYEWPEEPSMVLGVSILLIQCLLFEMGTFIVMHAFGFRPSHWFTIARQFYLFLLAAQAIPEWYGYLKGNLNRIGHNVWLSWLLSSVEVMIIFKYGKMGNSFVPGGIKIPYDVIICWASFFLLSLISFRETYLYRNNGTNNCIDKKMEYDKKKEGKIEVLEKNVLSPCSSISYLFRFMSFLPLVYLTRFWDS